MRKPWPTFQLNRPEADTAASLDDALVALSADACLPESFCQSGWIPQFSHRFPAFKAAANASGVGLSGQVAMLTGRFSQGCLCLTQMCATGLKDALSSSVPARRMQKPGAAEVVL